MSLLLIVNPPTELAISSEWTDFVNRSNKNMIGHGLSIPIFTLTNWDGLTLRPVIAQGSIIEVGGSFYQANSDTAIIDEGGLIDGTVHIKLVPTLEDPPLSLAPTLTNDVIPAWSANKGGWYDGADKFLPFEMTKAGAVYSAKGEYIDQNKLIERFSDGGIVLDGALTSSALTTGDITAENITGTAIIGDSLTADLVSTDNITEKTPNAGVSLQAKSGEQLREIVVSGVTAGSATLLIPKSISTANIRGLSASPNSTTLRVQELGYQGADIRVGLSGSSSGVTVYVVIKYID